MKNIEEQIRLVRRIQADLHKEGSRHRRDKNGMAAADCEEQAEGLLDVLDTLHAAMSLQKSISVLCDNTKNKEAAQ